LQSEAKQSEAIPNGAWLLLNFQLADLSYFTMKE